MTCMERRQTSKTAVFNLSYHVIWCTKYRRKVIEGDIEKRLRELLKEKANQLSMEIKELDIMPDHVHMFIKTQPIHSPQFAIGQLKGYTGRLLRQEFSSLKSRLPTLWTRSYYVDSVRKLNEYTTKQYVQNQTNK